MLGVFPRLRPIALDEKLIIAVGLDVEIALASESDDLHRDIVVDAVVEEHLAARRSHLSALVANNRVVQPKPYRPWQGAWKRPSGARDDLDAGADDLPQRLDVSRIEVQVCVDDRAIEVEGQHPIPRLDYRLTSGLRRFGGRPPRTAVAMLRAAIADISERVRTLALAMCGARMTFANGMRPGWTAGSRS